MMERAAEIYRIGVVDSTNQEMRRRLGTLRDLDVIAADSQSAGRGQGEHLWHSEPGLNLTFSILSTAPLSGREAVLTSCAATCGILDYLRGKGVEARIKWPNDIWVGDRKICGLLIENLFEGRHSSHSIIGVGFNLNETSWPEGLPNPVSLKDLTGIGYDTTVELDLLVTKIRRRLGLLASADGRSSLQEEFGKYVFRLP